MSLLHFDKQHSLAYDLCQKGYEIFPAMLYQNYCESITRFLNDHVLPRLKGAPGKDFLQESLKHWKNHKLMIKWMKRFFQYIDRYYVPKEKIMPLEEKGLELYKNIVFDGIKKALLISILREIQKLRENELVEKYLIRKNVEIYLDLSRIMPRHKKGSTLYSEELEKNYLQELESWYSYKIQAWATEPILEYIEDAYKAAETEKEIVETVLSSKTLRKVKTLFCGVVLESKRKFIMEREGNGLENLFCNGKENSREWAALSKIGEMYSGLAGGMEYLGSWMKAGVYKELAQLYAITNKDTMQIQMSGNAAKRIVNNTGFIEGLINIYNKYMKCLAECFKNK